MLNRRFLRVKIMQALYAYFQDSSRNISQGEKELILSVERLHDLYFYLLQLPAELMRLASQKLTDNSNSSNARGLKMLAENAIANRISEDSKLRSVVERKKVGWDNYQEELSKFFRSVQKTDAFVSYSNQQNPSFKQDRQFILDLFNEIILSNDLLTHAFFENSIYWSDEDFEYACNLVGGTVRKMKESGTESLANIPLFKDEKDDRLFIKDLYRHTIDRNNELDDIIDGKTKNWDVDRIAIIDIILMKMAVVELTEFSSIPVKVTLNEYIDISKAFSSPRSKGFINGVLDNIVLDLNNEKKIKKKGRGLLQ